MADKDHVHTVEEFIAERVAPDFQPIVAAFRKLIKEKFPELTEEMRGGTEAYYGVPAYRLKRIVVVISPTKQGITFAFSEGGKLEDKYKMLEGVGSKTLNIRLKSIDQFDDEKMAYYIRQAVELDQR
jgi:hypothetical protein